MTLHKITEFYTKLFGVCPNITSKFRTTAILKRLSKKIIIKLKLVDVYKTSFV
jgi:hypothetical protein